MGAPMHEPQCLYVGKPSSANKIVINPELPTTTVTVVLNGRAALHLTAREADDLLNLLLIYSSTLERLKGMLYHY